MSAKYLLVSACMLLAIALAACAPAVPAPGGPAAAASADLPSADLPPVELTYVYVGGLPQDQTAVNDAVNAYLQPKINATVKLQMLDWGAYTDKVNLMFASAEPCDVIWNAPWQAPSTQQLVANGSLLALDDLLPQYAPELMAAMPADGWTAAKVGGEIYGVPFQEIWVKPFGVAVRKDLADKYNFDVSTVETFEDLEPFLDAVLQGEPDVTPIGLWDSQPSSIYMAETFGFDPIVSQDLQVVVRYDDETLQAFNAFASPEFQSAVELAHKWYNAGYITKDLVPAADYDAQFKAGKFAVGLGTIAKPGGEAEFKSRRGYDVYQKSLTTPFKTTGAVAASLTSICSQSEHPERAAMFINLLQTDPELYNLLAYGIEGKHWVWEDSEQKLIKAGPDKDAYNPSSNWLFGNTTLAYYADPVAAANKTLEQTAALNNSSAPSVALGFSFDPEPVKNEIAQVSAIVRELGYPLINGMADPATKLPEFQDRLKAAGMDKIVAEAQKQLDAWAQTK
jgi:putative aldouronate transport system substrate-binding protein